MADEFKYPHIGEKITEVLQSKFWSKTSLGDAIGMSQSNAIYLTNRKNIDVENLHKISVALRHNFFKYYPVEEAPIEKNKEIDPLKTKIAELEKQLEVLKSQNDVLLKENGYLKEINELLKRK
jgi:DNA-binding Xre family transcriptional regulator